MPKHSNAHSYVIAELIQDWIISISITVNCMHIHETGDFHCLPELLNCDPTTAVHNTYQYRQGATISLERRSQSPAWTQTGENSPSTRIRLHQYHLFQQVELPPQYDL